MKLTTRARRGVVFDKDGTLLDFHATWDAALGAAFAGVDDPDDRAAAAEALGFDLTTGEVVPGSAFIAGTPEEMTELIGEIVDMRAFGLRLVEAAEDTLMEMAGASELLGELADRGVPMAVATNDAGWLAARQTEQLGWTDHFCAIVGSDAGHGAKPGPGMVHAAARACGLDASAVVMVGDSRHDLIAARAAGSLAVMIGDQADAIEHADVRISSLAEVARLV